MGSVGAERPGAQEGRVVQPVDFALPRVIVWQLTAEVAWPALNCSAHRGSRTTVRSRLSVDGIRPEHLCLRGSGVRAEVSAVELSGSETEANLPSLAAVKIVCIFWGCHGVTGRIAPLLPLRQTFIFFRQFGPAATRSRLEEAARPLSGRTASLTSFFTPSYCCNCCLCPHRMTPLGAGLSNRSCEGKPRRKVR
jgi:hypothetical protein